MTPEDGGVNEDGHNKVKEEQWKRTLPLAEAVRKAGGFAAYIKANEEKARELFSEAPVSVCCMDERVAGKRNAIAVGGSAIPFIDGDEEAYARFITYLKKRGVKKITLHEQCGAIRGVYARMHGISPKEAEERAKKVAQRINADLGGNPDEEIEVLPVEPKRFHYAQGIYLVLTENFNPSAVEGLLPPGFQASNEALGFTATLAQLKIALEEITFTTHGFNERFTVEHPFTVVIVANNENELKAVQSSPMLEEVVAPYNGRVVIDGFVAPKGN
jgi:hypothetical protein